MNTVTERALVRRINRRLAPVRAVRTPRRRYYLDYGPYWLIDIYRNWIVNSGLDLGHLEHMARELSALRDDETVS